MKKQKEPPADKRSPTTKSSARVVGALEPFFLPGDSEPPLEPPCSVEDLKAKVNEHLQSGCAPRHQIDKEVLQMFGIDGAADATRATWRWLVGHALNGSAHAQREVFNVAMIVVRSFVLCAGRKLPGVVERAKNANAMPGFVSQDSCVQEDMSRLCREIDQGMFFPFPLKPPGGKGKKQKAKLSTAQHDLVNRLWKYMEDHRRRIAIAAYRADLALMYGDTDEYAAKFGERCSRENIPPLLLAMMELPPLSSGTWEKWRDVGRRVIEASTNGNPAQHPAFQPGGFFASLGLPDPRAKRQEINLWKRLSEAWEIRAQEMARLPEESSHRKPCSRQ